MRTSLPPIVYAIFQTRKAVLLAGTCVLRVCVLHSTLLHTCTHARTWHDEPARILPVFISRARLCSARFPQFPMLPLVWDPGHWGDPWSSRPQHLQNWMCSWWFADGTYVCNVLAASGEKTSPMSRMPQRLSLLPSSAEVSVNLARERASQPHPITAQAEFE